ncbi:MAG: GGDEF domain-containing protein [Acidisphaera sp.]|nr:GGDEF domain-containing protein [Acidisphaera sp.]
MPFDRITRLACRIFDVPAEQVSLSSEGTLCLIDDKPRCLGLDDQRVLADLSALAAAQLDLQRGVGRIDPTSLLPNRSRLLEALEQAGFATPRERRILLLLDLAGPGQLDDLLQLLGPAECDNLVRSTAGIVQEVLGEGVTLYHVDTLRFACVLEDGVAFGWHAPAEALLARLRQPVLCSFIPIGLSPGIGIVPFRLGAAAHRDLLRRALAAAHEARLAGTGWAAYDPRQDQAQQRAFTLLGDLRRALEQLDAHAEGELSLAYQPRIDLDSGTCSGAEALLRWQHRTLGAVPPGEFVQLAERTALMVPLTDWVIDTALAQAAAFRAVGLALRVSINVSGRDFAAGDLPTRLAAALRHHGLPPQALEIEVRQSVLLQDSAGVREQLREVRMSGVELSVDDFGTGCGVLSALQQIPIGSVKLDQSLVRALAHSRRDRTIARAMIGVAHDVGYRVVAQGVETPELRDLVAEFGCDEAQGHQIARPMSADALGLWFDRSRLAELDRPMEVAAAE